MNQKSPLQSKEVLSKRFFILFNLPKDISRINSKAIELALKGKWKDGFLFLKHLSNKDNCYIQNNLALFYEMLSKPNQSIKKISRARFLCPDNKIISRNFRAILAPKQFIQPVYKLE